MNPQNQKPIYKYHLNREIGNLPKKWSLTAIKSILKKQFDISPATFDRDRNILLQENSYIPTDRLDKYAILFAKTADELKNYTITGKSINDIEDNEIESKFHFVKP